jgi:hypothetical protein
VTGRSPNRNKYKARGKCYRGHTFSTIVTYRGVAGGGGAVLAPRAVELKERQSGRRFSALHKF